MGGISAHLKICYIMPILSVVSSGLNALGNIIGTAMTNSANKHIMESQQAWSERMWQRNNDYNTPSNQMQRLVEAGISPAFAAQTISGGNSSSPAQGVSSPQMQNPFQNIGTSITEPLQQAAQAGVLSSQEALNNARARNETAETKADILLKGKHAGLFDSQTKYQDILNMFATERESYKTEEQKAAIAKSLQDAELSRQKAIESKDSQAKIKADTDIVNLQLKLLPQLTAAQVYSLRKNADAALQQAATQSNLSKAQIQQLNALRDKLTEEVLGAKSQSEISRIESELANKLGIDPKTAAMFVGSILSSLSKIKF